MTGVSELVLEQNDLAAAEHFYADVLGFPVVERWARNGEAVWVMAGDRTRIGLWRPQLGLGGGRGGVHVHYAMQLPVDAYEAFARWSEGCETNGYTVLDHDHSAVRPRSRTGGLRHGPGRPRGRVLDLGTWPAT